MNALLFTNPWGEKFYLANLGAQWPSHPERRLVERTVKDVAEAKMFKSEEDARAVLVVIGHPPGWEVVEA